MSRRQPKRLAALTAELSLSTVFDNEEERASDESEWLEVLHIGDVYAEADGGAEVCNYQTLEKVHKC